MSASSAISAYLAIAAASLLSASPAIAALIQFDISMDPSQVAPVTPNVTGFSPIGSATIIADTNTLNVSITGTFTGLTGNAIAAHVHGLFPADIFSEVVILPITFDPATSGSFFAGEVLIPSDFQKLLDGLTFIQVHTALNPSGEIRGQIPAPGALALGGLAIALLVSRRRF